MSDLITEARGWIADAFSDVDAGELTDAQVRRGVEHHYEGGWAQFASDGA
jgi:hypothetical protein